MKVREVDGKCKYLKGGGWEMNVAAGKRVIKMGEPSKTAYDIVFYSYNIYTIEQ